MPLDGRPPPAIRAGGTADVGSVLPFLDDRVTWLIAEARAAGAVLLRVDCWAGASRLVQWYEEQGFRRVSTFDVGEWRGQLFELRV